MGVVPPEDLVGPGDDGVDDFVESGYLASGVEIREPSKRPVGSVLIFG